MTLTPVAPLNHPPELAPPPPWSKLAIVLLCGLFLVIGLRAVVSMSPTLDEPGHYRYGHRILRGVAERWDDSKMPISALNALPCFVAETLGFPLRDADEFAGPCHWTLARVPSLLGGLALGLVIAAWSRALFGWSGALVSLGLFACDPNLLAHSSLITTDIFGALFLLLALRAFAQWLKTPTLRQAVLLGLAVGMASISKYTAAYLPVIFLVAAWARRKHLAGHGSTALRRLGAATLAVVIALLVINAGFLADHTGTSLRDQRFESPQFRELGRLPVLARIPLPVPRPFVEGLDRVFHRERNGGGSGNIYLLGELRSPGSKGFIAYFIVVGFVKTPIPTLIALGLAVALLLKRGWRSWSADEVTLVATVVIFTLYFSLLFRAQIGLRHFLVVFPPLLVLMGCLGPFLARSNTRVVLGIMGLGLSVASVAWHGDDPLSYFNEFVNPRKTYLIAADSNLEWGQSQERVDAYLASHPEVLNAPAKAFPGRILVGANQLTGVVTRKRMEWLRNSGMEPIGHVAFTHFLFDITRADADRLRREAGERPLPPG